MPDILVVRSSELLIRQDNNNGSRQRRDGIVRRRVQVADKENGECLTVQQCNPLPCLRCLNHWQRRSKFLPIAPDGCSQHGVKWVNSNPR
jgi:hypothetical protein